MMPQRKFNRLQPIAHPFYKTLLVVQHVKAWVLPSFTEHFLQELLYRGRTKGTILRKLLILQYDDAS
jgi:hypothetical protein